MPEDAEPEVITYPKTIISAKKSFYILAIALAVIFLVFTVFIIDRQLSPKSGTQPQVSASPSPSGVGNTLLNITGVVKTTDFKKRTITLNHDQKTDTYTINDDTLISEINFNAQQIPSNGKAVSIPTKKITLKDIRTDQEALLVFDNTGKMLQLQVQKK